MRRLPRLSRIPNIFKPILTAIKITLMVIGAATVVGIIILGIGIYILTRPSGIASEMDSVPVSEEAAESFDAKFSEFETLLDNAMSGESVSLSLTEEEVASKLDELIKDTDMPIEVKDTCVNFRDGAMWISGVVDAGVSVSSGIKVAIDIDEEGKPQLEIEDVDIGGGVPVPGSLEEQITNLIPTDDVLTEDIDELPVMLESVAMEDGGLTFTGTKT